MNLEGGGSTRSCRRERRSGNDVNTVLMYKILKNKNLIKCDNISTNKFFLFVNIRI